MALWLFFFPLKLKRDKTDGFNFYNSGMQTWEYAPQYALRTYLYVWPMAILSILSDKILRYVCPKWVIGMLLQWGTMNVDADDYNFSFDDNDDNTKVFIFRILRCALALFTAVSEVRFCYALGNVEVSSSLSSSYSLSRTQMDVPIWTLFLLLTSAGMFHAGPALLPSSTVMVCWMNSAVHQLRVGGYRQNNSDNRNGEKVSHDREKDRYNEDNFHVGRAILWGLLAVLGIGWPFCAVLFIPLGIFAMIGAYFSGGIRSTTFLLLQTFVKAAMIQSIAMIVDRVQYGRWVCPTLNIFRYNTSGGGDELYGTEPMSYYAWNMMLNWNAVAVAGAVSLPLLLVLPSSSSSQRGKKNGVDGSIVNRDNDDNDPYHFWRERRAQLILLPMYLWLAIVVPRPHKEERFLFPIYPMIAAGCALLLRRVFEYLPFDTWIIKKTKTSVNKRTSNHSHHRHRNNEWMKTVVGLVILSPVACISVMRSVGLNDGYTSPLRIYRQLHRRIIQKQQSTETINIEKSKKHIAASLRVCTCGEWYRYPSSYHLSSLTELSYLRSSFDGQLPGRFAPYGSSHHPGDGKIGDDDKGNNGILKENREPSSFNDMNREENDRYVDIKDCSYVVELIDDNGDSSEEKVPECLQYMKKDGWHRWRIVAQGELMICTLLFLCMFKI